jgi:hypothetical protein
VAGGFINPYPDPIPDDSHHREKYLTGWLGWKNEWKSCLLLVVGLTLFGSIVVGAVVLVNYLYS